MPPETFRWEDLPGRRRSASCDLCEEAPMTEWFHADTECWIAECEACSVPMIVWRNHDRDPPPEVRAALRALLVEVAEREYDFADGIHVDDHMRNVPDHYHAHARPRRGPFGPPPRRR